MSGLVDLIDRQSLRIKELEKELTNARQDRVIYTKETIALVDPVGVTDTPPP